MAIDFTITKRVKVTSTKATRAGQATHKPPASFFTGWNEKRNHIMCSLCTKRRVVGGDVRCKFCIEAQA